MTCSHFPLFSFIRTSPVLTASQIIRSLVLFYASLVNISLELLGARELDHVVVLALALRLFETDDLVVRVNS